MAGGRGRQCEKGRLQPPRQAPVCWAEPPGDPTSLEVTVVTIRGQRHRVSPAETQEAAKTGNTHLGALSGSGSLEWPGHPRPGAWQRRPDREGSTRGRRKLGDHSPTAQVQLFSKGSSPSCLTSTLADAPRLPQEAGGAGEEPREARGGGEGWRRGQWVRGAETGAERPGLDQAAAWGRPPVCLPRMGHCTPRAALSAQASSQQLPGPLLPVGTFAPSYLCWWLLMADHVGLLAWH